MATVSKRDREIDVAFARYIEENPFKPGVANARLVESGMAIWAFAGALEAPGNDADIADALSILSISSICQDRVYKAHGRMSRKRICDPKLTWRGGDD